MGGCLRAESGTLNEFSSVTKVTKSSKSAKLGAWKITAIVTDIPEATSPLVLSGYFTRSIVNTSVAGGINLMRLALAATFVTLTKISYTPFTW
jgi:hypothetical protein